MIIEPAKRTDSIKEYYFSTKNVELARLNAERQTPIINLGIGAPDGFPPVEAVETLCQTASMATSHKYQNYYGIPELRQAFADWYARYYKVELDPNTEIQPLAGSKEGILISCLAFLNKGDKVLVPNPGYPTYISAAKVVEAQIINYDLLEENGYQPDFDALEKMDLSGVKMMWTNYPNMPTGAAATKELYEKIVDFARRHKILVCNDNPYSFILNNHPLSILEVAGAKECCVEFNSLSKAHNMSGWRIGMVAGEEDVIKEIRKVKSQMDSGMFLGLQKAAIAALQSGPEWFEALNAEYRKRREAASKIMDLVGAKYNPDSTGLFLWGKVDGSGSDMSDKLLYEAGVFVTPGFIFGSNGDNFIRISLCAPVPVMEEALRRIKEVL